MFGKLRDDVAKKAVRIASGLIIAIAKQIADTGCRPGKLALVSGCADGSEIELDRSLENFVEAPEKGSVDNLVSYVRRMEKKAFVMMLDCSYSMKNKIILAAITAAAIAQHFKKDYAILAFNKGVGVLKRVDEPAGPEKVLHRLFKLESYGDTNIRMALESGLKHVRKFERKEGLILTDGDWNSGGDPFASAVRFDKLSVIGFPFANFEKIRLLSLQGNGVFSVVDNETEIVGAILKCLS